VGTRRECALGVREKETKRSKKGSKKEGPKKNTQKRRAKKERPKEKLDASVEWGAPECCLVGATAKEKAKEKMVAVSGARQLPRGVAEPGTAA